LSPFIEGVSLNTGIYIEASESRRTGCEDGVLMMIRYGITKNYIMKIRTYVLSVTAGILFLSAGTDRASLTEGCRPGNLAPGIKSRGTDTEITFLNDSGRYTLLHFWAAYDAESRMRNVQLWNELNHNGGSQVKMVSVSMDRLTSVFTGTVKIDKLEETNQVHEALGERSEVYGKYGLKKGLRNFLIDGRGVIIATDITPGRLYEIISKRKSQEKRIE
jgi:hypothetical protein